MMWCQICCRYHESVTGIWILPQPQLAPMGWTCPKCGSVYAPSHIECYRCNEMRRTP